MLPLGDENPTKLMPLVNWSIIVTCLLVFLWQTSGGNRQFYYTLFEYGLVPSRVVSGKGLYTFVTNIFLHGSWIHLLGNMLFLWIFGDNIEDCCGHLRYLGFYIACGIAASVFWVLTSLGSHMPAVGASGAISGVLGAYFVLYPKKRIRTLIGLGIFWSVVRIPAFVMIGLWFLYQFALALIPMDASVAYWAHIGGFIAGLILSMILKPKLRVSKAHYLQDLR